jgi:hypothetical protein
MRISYFWLHSCCCPSVSVSLENLVENSMASFAILHSELQILAFSKINIFIYFVSSKGCLSWLELSTGSSL